MQIKLIKKIAIMALLLCIFSFTAFCQPRTAPAVYTADNSISYIRSWDASSPETNPNSLTLSSSVRQFKMSSTYIDGLGRPIETVMKQGSLKTGTIAVDLINAMEYDQYGRELYKDLPFNANNSNNNNSITDGLFKLNPYQQQAYFYNDANSTNPVSGQGEVYYYNQINFEPSPLSRVTKRLSAGNNWVGASRGIDNNYWLNTAIDEVRIWIVTNGAEGSFSSYATGASYDAGLLIKNVTLDENGKQLIEFKDKEGKIILKKVQVTATQDVGLGKDHNGWLCTYYIYDIMSNLSCVIQPKGVELIAANWTLTDPTILAEQCFRYEYDKRNRIIIKKVPGATEVYMVYDVRDRLVMTQDANLRASNKWMITLYDNLNRPIQTGLLLNTFNNYNFSSHLTAAYGSSTYPFTTTNTPSTNYWEYLTKTGYDNYNSIPTPSGLNNSIDPTYFTSTYGYNSAFNTAPDYPQQIPSNASVQTKGLATWTETKILNTTSYIYSVILYDDRARVVQVKSKNITTGIDINTTQYSFSGQPLVTIQKQEKAGTPSQTNVIITQLTYDDLNRVTKTEKKLSNSLVNNGAMPTIFTTVATLEYDALGQITKKLIGNKKDPQTGSYYSTRQPLQEMVYDYNIRGWMLGINRDYLQTEGQTSDGKYFGFELGYDKASTKSGRSFVSALQYNGNITGVIWKSDGDDIRRKYDFTYDPVNRLIKADFEQNNGDDHSWNNNQINYAIKMGDGNTPSSAYDGNGNIQAMTQYGFKLGSPSTSPIDNLSYNYILNSNKLKQVIDGNNDKFSKLGDFKYDEATKTATDYSYDLNGNLSQDNNKNINSITYNHLNLPLLLTVTNKGTIVYTYDATGSKYKKVTTETNVSVPYNGANYTSNITTITTYLGSTIFETKLYNNTSLSSLNYTDRLQFISQEEGRIRFKPETTSLHYDYMLKDHLGNVRMVLTEELQTDTYPAATMETAVAATAANEELYYSNLPLTRTTTLPSGYPANTPSGNAAVAKVSAASGAQKVGPAITLKVMAGDKFNLIVNSWYKKNGVTPDPPINPLADLLTALASNFAKASGKFSATELTNSNVLSPGASQFLGSQTPASGVPKAYVNWILFDEQFKIVIGSSSFEQVGADQVYTTHVKNALSISKNGYLYIYVSNETPNIDVFFDNLQITHIRGPILEETHYYPFGLTMAGISSKAAGVLENKKQKFQGQEFASKEFSDGSGLEMYEFKWRMDDPQTGRFWQIDPLADKYVYNSPYAFSENKVTVHRELEGLEAEYIYQKAKEEIASTFQGAANWIDNSLNYFTKFGALTEVASTPEYTISEGTTATTNISTNFGGNMSFIIGNNTNVGNTEPFTKKSVTIAAEQKTELKGPGASLTNKNSVDNNGVKTIETGIKTDVKVRGLPVTVTASGATSTDGKSSAKVEASTGTTNVKAKSSLEYSIKGNQQSVSVGVGGEVKAGKTTTSSSIGFRFGW